MDDAVLVCVLHRIEHARDQLGDGEFVARCPERRQVVLDLGRDARQRTDLLGQVVPLDEFHREPPRDLVPSGVDDRDDAGMGERAHGRRFALEAAHFDRGR
jgi:hypothetical protein